MKQSGKKGTVEEQYKNCYKITRRIVENVKDFDKHDRLIKNHEKGKCKDISLSCNQ